jgi:hypothetical protein
MANEQRLRLTLKDRQDGREWTGHRLDVREDPEDLAAIEKHIENLARNLDHRTGEADHWIERYEARVQGLDEEWRDYRVAGRKR